MVNLDKCISYEEYISTAKEEEILFIDELFLNFPSFALNLICTFKI